MAPRKQPLTPSPEAASGDIVAVPLPKGRWGAICLLDVSPLSTRRTAWRFYVLDGFWSAPPTPAQFATRVPMPDPYGHLGLGAGGPWKGWFASPYPQDFVIAGAVVLSKRERSWNEGIGTMVFQSGDHFRTYLHEKWRERYDQAALAAEQAKARAAYVRAQARAVAERKATITLPRMLREAPFAHWREHWGARVVRDVTDAFRVSTRALIRLGRDGDRKQKVAVFHRLVEALNVIDDRAGCIETGEREELVARIEEMARLVGLRNTNERLTGARDW